MISKYNKGNYCKERERTKNLFTIIDFFQSENYKKAKPFFGCISLHIFHCILSCYLQGRANI